MWKELLLTNKVLGTCCFVVWSWENWRLCLLVLINVDQVRKNMILGWIVFHLPKSSLFGVTRSTRMSCLNMFWASNLLLTKVVCTCVLLWLFVVFLLLGMMFEISLFVWFCRTWEGWSWRATCETVLTFYAIPNSDFCAFEDIASVWYCFHCQVSQGV